MLTQITEDIKKAIKSGETPKRDILRMVKDILEKKEKSLLRPLENGEAIQAIETFVKQMREELDYAYKGNVDKDKLNRLIGDIEIVKAYLPVPLSEEEVLAIINNVIDQTVVRNMGNIMKSVKPLVEGRVEGKVLSDLVKRAIQ